MLDQISIGMSGLQSFSKGLKVISNNIANLNTPGFKSSDLPFANLFYQGGTANPWSGGTGQLGTGVTTLSAFINFKPGDTRQTGNALDLSIDGEGFFVTRNPKDGTLTYSRAGQFEFDAEGMLVSRATGRQVMGYGADGSFVPISLSGMRVNPPKATTEVKFTGNLSSSVSDFTVDAVKVIDAVGGVHLVKVVLKGKENEPGTWSVTVVDGTSEFPAGELQFVDGTPAAGSSRLNFSYASSGVAAFDVALDFSGEVTSFAAGTLSTLALSKADGLEAGTLTQVTFDAEGNVTFQYSNGHKATGSQLALAAFESKSELDQLAAGEFSIADAERARTGRAGSQGLGKIVSNQIEVSNVDLSSEFSNLIVMQRGYQASSRVVSTANEMLEELFDMKGRR